MPKPLALLLTPLKPNIYAYHPHTHTHTHRLAVASLVAGHRRLTGLDASCVGWDAEGALAVAAALSKTVTLRVLNVSAAPRTCTKLHDTEFDICLCAFSIHRLYTLTIQNKTKTNTHVLMSKLHHCPIHNPSMPDPQPINARSTTHQCPIHLCTRSDCRLPARHGFDLWG
jgi:hypothetical protein